MTKDKIDELFSRMDANANDFDGIMQGLRQALQSQQRELKKAVHTINAASLELGVKQDNHPVPVANAIDLLNSFLSEIDKGEWLL